ncbi:hypothetical protein C0J52_17160 [Blattella germanica]|nr:hypothetical protein C0J52_17160 [Blattella germanica]
MVLVSKFMAMEKFIGSCKKVTEEFPCWCSESSTTIKENLEDTRILLRIRKLEDTQILLGMLKYRLMA